MTHQDGKIEIATEPQRSHYHMLANCCEVMGGNTIDPKNGQASDFVCDETIKI